MLDTAVPFDRIPARPGARGPNLNTRPHFAGVVVFVAALALGLAYTLHGLTSDIEAGGVPVAGAAVLLLGLVLLIALGFEFVNGFHDTANAVATVIYTHSLPPQAAVVWSGCFNVLGVLTSSGAVAFGIVSLLPVKLILQAGSGAGYAMIFALLIAAIIWNLGTWSLGLPASSSHTLIGSIMGMGLANQLLAPQGSGTSGVDWTQALGVFKPLLFSPLVGFACAGLLLLAMKALVRSRHLYEATTTCTWTTSPWMARCAPGVQRGFSLHVPHAGVLSRQERDLSADRSEELPTKLKRWARRIKRDVVALWIAARDPRVPWYAKAVCAAIAAYALSPIDLIPDFIPVLGYLDEVILLPLAILLAVRLVPPQLMAEFRADADLRAERPVSRVAAAFTVVLWITAGALALWLFWSRPIQG